MRKLRYRYVLPVIQLAMAAFFFADLLEYLIQKPDVPSSMELRIVIPPEALPKIEQYRRTRIPIHTDPEVRTFVYLANGPAAVAAIPIAFASKGRLAGDWDGPWWLRNARELELLFVVVA